jgi:hypothetical protein
MTTFGHAIVEHGIPAFGAKAVLAEKKCPSLCRWTGLRLRQIDRSAIVTWVDRDQAWQALQVVDLKA